MFMRSGRRCAAVCEVKAGKISAGFFTLERWLGDAYALFLRRHRAEPLVAPPRRVWALLVKGRSG